MRCPHCQQEIGESGFVYCPHCGKELKPSRKKGIGWLKGGLLAFMVWVGLTAIAFVVDTIDGPHGLLRIGEKLYAWAPKVTAIFALAIFVIFGVWAIYNITKRRES